MQKQNISQESIQSVVDKLEYDKKRSMKNCNILFILILIEISEKMIKFNKENEPQKKRKMNYDLESREKQRTRLNF
jgi:hypothetical protein